MPDPSPANFIPWALDLGTHAAIGKLVRACAEIEDIVTLYIAQLSGIDIGTTAVLLGRSTHSSKLTILEYLAKMKGEHEVFKAAFNGLTNGIKARNHVCHGVYIGRDQNGQLGFLTTDRVEPDGEIVVQKVQAYKVETLESIASKMSAYVPMLEHRLQLDALRDTRRGLSLEDLQAHRRQNPKKL